MFEIQNNFQVKRFNIKYAFIKLIEILMPIVCYMLVAGHLTLTPQLVRRGRSDFPMLQSAKEFTLPTDMIKVRSRIYI